MQKNNLKGFTLIEILVVIGMIAVLATIVIVAINPARQFAASRNTQRLSNVNAILNAIGENIADNHGQLDCPEQPSTTPLNITSATSTDGVNRIGVNLMPCLVPNYLSSILYDPKWGRDENGTSTYNTNYLVSQDEAGRVTVKVKQQELNEDISVTR